VEAFPITIEVFVGNGLGYSITGQPDDIVRESLTRVKVSLISMGFHMPRQKLSINLSPVNLRKTGAGFDLPIALGILKASAQIDDLGKLGDFLLAGELGLDGSIYPIPGTLCIAELAIKERLRGIIIPEDNVREACLLGGLEIYGVNHLMHVLEFILSDIAQKLASPIFPSWQPHESADLPDFKEVRGQYRVKRGLEISAAGGHNSLIIGPPGVGKTMLASRLPSILPPMTSQEMLETTKIYSICDQHMAIGPVTVRPFRHPHHTASALSLAGGGSIPHPGEISLAHNGVLFLDEFYEFSRLAIETLRQPMEEGKVRIARAKQSLEFPADFMLVAAMNPCFCGYFGHPTRKCSCSKRALEYYRRKIGGPLLDRIDLHIQAEPIPLSELAEEDEEAECSTDIRWRVLQAREIQERRYGMVKGVACNARMPDKDIPIYCRLDAFTKRFLFRQMEKLQLSARAYSRILKLGRTIADLAGSKDVELEHVAEAVSFRVLDRVVNVETKNTWRQDKEF
jgi:magnesium chelatase family protein